MTASRIVAAPTLFVLVALSGCGGESASLKVYTPKEVMEDVGSMYKEYTTDRKVAPKQLSDFDMPYEPAHQLGYAAIRDGNVIMLWGGSLTGGADRVVAYEKQVPESGGLVALQDGTVKTVTAEEFRAAAKIK